MKKVVALLMVMALFLAGCIEQPMETPSKETAGVIQAPVKTQKLEFAKAKMIEMEGEMLVAVFFDYTNGSGETRMPCDDFDVKMFQNGVELNILVYSGEKIEGAIQCDTEVQSGTTVRTIWTFEPEDNSTVTIEVSNGQRYEFKIEG